MRDKIYSYKKFLEGNGPKGKDSYIFVRFGGLNLVVQKGYSNNPKSFHAPPSPRGIYAMPKCCQEMFLIGSIGDFQPGTMPKKPKWNELSKEEYDEVYIDYQKKVKKSFQNLRREFRKTSGYIWHHLMDYCKPYEVISRHGSWIKTDMETWRHAFMKSTLNDRYGEFNCKGEKSINNTKGLSGYYSKDHYEVFFDEKV